MKKDELGSRMKENYEERTRYLLPRRTYTIIRLDGKAFHTYTRGFNRPYDERLMATMDQTAIALCKQIQGVKLAYVQSDEITLVLTDFETIKTDAWFDGNIQKMASVSASIAGTEFNRLMLIGMAAESGHDMVTLSLLERMKLAQFDSRVFSIGDRNEVINNLIWRQQDATRNSIQMGAQALYSQKQLDKKNTSELQEFMFQKGINWNDYPVGFKRGRIILKEGKEEVPDHFHGVESVTRIRWASFEPPIFTQDPEFLRSRIPLIGESDVERSE